MQSNILTLSKEEIDKVDLSHLAHFLQWNPTYQKYFLQDAGQEPYKLIALLSQKVGGVAIDMGTLYGSSALALSYSESTRVITLDTKKQIPDTQDFVTPIKRQNVRMIVASCQSILPFAATADLIILDIDNQLSKEMTKVIDELRFYHFKGILVLNDIHLNEAMEQVWSSVPSNLKKIDATSLGHHSGTGLIVYDPTYIDVAIVPV